MTTFNDDNNQNIFYFLLLLIKELKKDSLSFINPNYNGAKYSISSQKSNTFIYFLIVHLLLNFFKILLNDKKHIYVYTIEGERIR